MRTQFAAAMLSLGYCATPPVTLHPLCEAPQVRPATALAGAWLGMVQRDSTVELNERDTAWVDVKAGNARLLQVHGLERADTDSVAWRYEAVVCEIAGERYLDIGSSHEVVRSGSGTVLPVHQAFRLRQAGDTIALGFFADTLWKAFLRANGLPVIEQESTCSCPSARLFSRCSPSDWPESTPMRGRSGAWCA